MKRRRENWNTAQGILDGIHRIREEHYKDRLRLGDAAWIKKVNETGQRIAREIEKRRAIMTRVAQEVVNELKTLPAAKQREALDFVRFLKSQSRRAGASDEDAAVTAALLTKNPSLDFLRDEPDLYE